MWRRLLDRLCGARQSRVTRAWMALCRSKHLRDTCVQEARAHWQADAPNPLWAGRTHQLHQCHSDLVEWVLRGLQPSRRERQALVDAGLI